MGQQNGLDPVNTGNGRNGPCNHSRENGGVKNELRLDGI
jgi:hypothetical protein